MQALRLLSEYRDSGKPNVRFDERELEIEFLATTPALYSTVIHNRLLMKLLPKKVAVRSLMGSVMTRNKPVINRKNLIYLI